MGWLFLFAVLFLVAFLVLESTRTRIVAVGLLTVIAIIVSVFFLFLDRAEQQAVPPAADEKLKDTRELASEAALVREAIKPQEIAVDGPSFGPAKIEVRGNDGQLIQQPDLFLWRFGGALKNLSSKYQVRDVVFRLRLFSCPDFLTGDQELDALELRCNTIGDRRVALYNLGVEPGGSANFAETVTFDNQPNPGNWRYWVETISVTAKID